jgi:Holliday junction resolvase RusA-like endonuclease
MEGAEVHISVSGDPASQGSHAVMNGRIVQVNSAKHKRWRNAVRDAARAELTADWEPIDGPCEVIVSFYMPRPKTVTRPAPSVSPDLDKLCRSVLDSLSDAGVYADDSRVTRLNARKIYAQGIEPGASITVKAL